jgi:hypothetical protein
MRTDAPHPLAPAVQSERADLDRSDGSGKRNCSCRMQLAFYANADGSEVQPFDGIYINAFAFFDSLTTEHQATFTSSDVSMCTPATPATSPQKPAFAAESNRELVRNGRRGDRRDHPGRDRGHLRRHCYRMVGRDHLRHELRRWDQLLDFGSERVRRLSGSARLGGRRRRRSEHLRVKPCAHHPPRPNQRLRQQRHPANSSRHGGWRCPRRQR